MAGGDRGGRDPRLHSATFGRVDVHGGGSSCALGMARDCPAQLDARNRSGAWRACDASLGNARTGSRHRGGRHGAGGRRDGSSAGADDRTCGAAPRVGSCAGGHRMSLRVTDLPDWLTSTLASDARGGDGALPGWIRPLRPGQHTIGVASTATLAGGGHLGLRQAIEKGPAPGPVLVAFGSMTGDRAVIGDVLGNWLLARGFTALITDGLVRDSARL